MHRNEERATKLLQITYDINLICFQMDFFPEREEKRKRLNT